MFRYHFKLNSKSLKYFYGCNRFTSRVAVNESVNESEPKPFKAIPSLPTIPVLGSSWLSLPYIGKYDLTRFHERIYQIHTEYGKIVREQFLDVNIVWVFDANDVQTVFRNEGKYPRRIGFGALKLCRKLRPNYYSTGGLLLAQGEEWYNFRSKTQPYLLKPKLVQSYIPVMNSIANQMIERIHNLSSRNDYKIDNFVNELYRWALESIGVVVLDKRLGCLQIPSDHVPNNGSSQQLIDSGSNMILYSGILESQVLALWRIFQKPFGKQWQKLLDANDKFTEIVLQYIGEARERLKDEKQLSNNKDKSILQLLLSRPDFTAEEAVTMTLDLFMAGIDTTSHSLIYALYFMAKDKRIQEEARREVNTVIGDMDEISVEMINQLYYLRACIKESQRLMPTIIVNTRILSKEVILSGYRVPPRTIIAIGHYVMGRIEKYYSDPLTYKPERWIKSVSGPGPNQVYTEEIHPFATLPFGYGPRMCIGHRIALQEQLLLLSKLLQNYEINFEGAELGIVTKVKPLTTPEKPLTFTFNRLN